MKVQIWIFLWLMACGGNSSFRNDNSGHGADSAGTDNQSEDESSAVDEELEHDEADPHYGESSDALIRQTERQSQNVEIEVIDQSGSQDVQDDSEDFIVDVPAQVGGAFLHCYHWSSGGSSLGCRMEHPSTGLKVRNWKYEMGATFEAIDINNQRTSVIASQSPDHDLFHWLLQSQSPTEISSVFGSFRTEHGQKKVLVKVETSDRFYEPIDIAKAEKLNYENVTGFLTGASRCLRSDNEGLAVMAACDQNQGLKLLNEGRELRITRLKPIFKLPDLALEAIIKDEPEGPAYQVMFDGGDCLVPVKRDGLITSVLDEIPKEKMKWTLGACITDETDIMIRSQAFYINSANQNQVILQSNHYRTTSVLKGQKELCVGFDRNSLSAAIQTFICDQPSGGPMVGFSIQEALK